MQSEALDIKLSVEETMVEAAPDAKINDIKALLGRMMFSGKSMAKRVSHRPPYSFSQVCLWQLPQDENKRTTTEARIPYWSYQFTGP
jgi:hypothetical protein